MDRRTFLTRLGSAPLAVPLLAAHARSGGGSGADPVGLTLFLAGDVMTGRGIDQVLPFSADPTLHEPYVRDAREYVRLAERENGEVPAPVSFDYVWGDALTGRPGHSPLAHLWK